jgi:8-oxo-dGTP pyrophosphatase MutT (NUDIX family)
MSSDTDIAAEYMPTSIKYDDNPINDMVASPFFFICATSCFSNMQDEIVIIAKGKFYLDNINVFYKSGRISQSKDAIQFIESKWTQFVANNPNSFSGALVRVDSYNVQNNNNNLIELQLSDTDYKEFVGTRDCEFVRRFGIQYTANPLSVGAVLVTKDNKIVLGKRAEHMVDVGKSKVSVVAGYLDPKQDMVNSPTDNNNIDIFSAVKREIYEETGIIEEKHIVDLICLGLIDNKEKNQINVPFYCKLNIPAKEFEVKDKSSPHELEFSKIVIIDNSVKSIDDFINAAENELSDIIVPTLCIYKDLIQSTEGII